MNRINRRSFLTGSAAAAAATMTPGLSFAGAKGGTNDEVLIYVFLRGGIDGLSLYAPGAGHPDRGFYEGLRPSASVRLPTSGTGALLSLNNGDGFGLNSAADPLRDLWDGGDLAIVHATGLPIVNRSHFEAERFIELGTPGATEGLPPGQGPIDGVRTTSTGWLTRHLASADNLPPTMTMPVVATESQTTLSLTNEPAAVTLRYPSDFDLSTYSQFEEQVEDRLASIYAADGSDIGIAGEQAMIAQALIENVFDTSNKDYNIALGSPYPVRDVNDNLESISDKLITLARLIKAGLDLRIAQVDYGGWDDHTDQGSLPVGVGSSSGRYHDRLDRLSRAVNAFWADMAGQYDTSPDRRNKVTVVFHSEFGRRAYNNNDNGTDHGSGNPMMLLGGNVNGGQFHGTWPGMAPGDLYQGNDLRTTTDFRRILSEVLIRRQGNPNLGMIFPYYYNYQPMGVVSGTDQLPNYGPNDEITVDGFE